MPAAAKKNGELVDLEVLNAVAEQPQDDSVWNSEDKPGLKLKILKVNKLLLRDIVMRIPMPVPPKFYNEDKEEEEDNPLDPTYLREQQEAIEKRSNAIMNFWFGYGTKPLEIPEDMIAHTEDDWIDDLESMGFSGVPRKGTARYAAWVRYYALTSDEMVPLTHAIHRFNGITPEVDVAEARDSFQGDEESDTDSRTRTEENT